jgi:hypothetical protein
MARVIDGKAIAKALRASIKRDVQHLTGRHGRVRRGASFRGACSFWGGL